MLNFKLKNILIKLLLTTSLFLFSSMIVGQSAKEFDKKWELAKGHFNDQNYDMAVMVFKSLTVENDENKYTQFANYYTALCFYHQNKLRDSRQYLLQLKNKYPYWKSIQEANYLLANIEFIENNYDKAIALLDSCNTKECKNLKLHYLSKIESIYEINALRAKHPNDAELNTIYTFKLAAKKPLFQSEIDTIHHLISAFNIKSSKLKSIIENSYESHFKDTFHVAILYPFYIEELKKLKSKRFNQFVIDHYWGLALAFDTLSKMGVQVKMHLYDSKNDSNEVKKILLQPELTKMDLLIGSIYPKNMKYIADFAYENQIICFNPLSTQSEIIIDSGFVFLHNATAESIGKSTAEFILDSFPNKKVMLLSFDNPKDTIIGYHFEKRLKKDSVLLTKKIIINKNTDVLSVLSKIKNTDVDVIFSPSTNTSIGTNLISWLIMREIDIPVIANAKWLDAKEYNILKANEFTTFFFNENYQNIALDSNYKFQEKYSKNYNIPPSEAAFKGFELGMFLGANLATYGKYFNQALWNMKPQAGVFYPFFDYNHSYFNNFVPIFKLHDFQLVPVNYNSTLKDELKNESINTK